MCWNPQCILRKFACLFYECQVTYKESMCMCEREREREREGEGGREREEEEVLAAVDIASCY